MKIFISSLVNDFDNMEEVALWVDSLKDPNIGVELIAFTHDKEYSERLNNILETITCPISFHGPYIDVEATSEIGSDAYEFYKKSYLEVAQLAHKYNVHHIVYHYSQLGFNEETLSQAKMNSTESIKYIQDLQAKYGVPIVIENLAFVKNTLPLYSNEQYKNIFSDFESAKSIIDVGHANINKLDVQDFLKTHGDRVMAYHFHNNDGSQDNHQRVRDGSVDYDEIMDAYNKYTPTANIVIEYEPHLNCTKEQLLDDINYIKSLIK